MAYANGLLIVSDTNGLAYEGGTNVLDEYDPAHSPSCDGCRCPVYGFVSGLAGDGLGGSNADWYSFNVNAGDNLVITTTTPGGTSASGLQFANDLDPTINLYDASGNLVATATGNAPDGRNDVIDWTALTPGSYRVQILGSSKTNLGEYTISIQGATGGLAPFTVTSTNPAAGSDIGYQVSTMDVSFSSSVLLSSVSDSDFTIDGNDATGFSVVNGDTVGFTFPTTANGVHNVSISGVENLQGTVAHARQLQLPDRRRASGRRLELDRRRGGALAGSPDRGDHVQQADSAVIGQCSDILLFGEVRGVEYAPSSISFDPTDTILTITYANLPSDAYQFMLQAGPGNFLSNAGVPLQNSFVINFTMPVGTTTITGLQPVLPLGSLVYDTAIDNVLLTSTDVDTYDLTIDPQPDPVGDRRPRHIGHDADRHPDFADRQRDRHGDLGDPGRDRRSCRACRARKGGTYQIVISGGPGEYTVQADSQRARRPGESTAGASNGSIATATPIDPYANKFAGNDDRMAVLGSITGGGFSFGDALVVEDEFGSGLATCSWSTKTPATSSRRTQAPISRSRVVRRGPRPGQHVLCARRCQRVHGRHRAHGPRRAIHWASSRMPVTDSAGLRSRRRASGSIPRTAASGCRWSTAPRSCTSTRAATSSAESRSRPTPMTPRSGPTANLYLSGFRGEITQFNPSTGTSTFFASSPIPTGPDLERRRRSLGR